MDIFRSKWLSPLSTTGPDLRLLSVLFCDMVESTEAIGAPQCGGDARADRRVPGNRRGRGQAVWRLRGKFLGDGVLAYFGWPMAYEDHAERAIAPASRPSGVGSLKTPPARRFSRAWHRSGRVVVGDLPEAAPSTVVRWRARRLT